MLPGCQASAGASHVAPGGGEQRALTRPWFCSASEPAFQSLWSCHRPPLARGEGTWSLALLTAFLSSPDADQVDSTTLLGKPWFLSACLLPARPVNVSAQ